MARLGLAYDDVAPTRPGLIYCQAHGFRSDTDAAHRPAYDDIIQALTGYPWLNATALGKTYFVPSTLGDKVAALTIVSSVLAALFHRERTGEGQRVEIPMFDAVLAFNLVEHLARATIPGEPAGYNRVLTSHRGPHRTVDGYVALLPYTDRQWQALFTAVGREELLDEPWFADHATRLRNADDVYAALAGIVRERTTAEWLEICEANGVPASPVPSLDEIVGDPRAAHGRHHRGRPSGGRALPADRASGPVLTITAVGAPPGPSHRPAHARDPRRGRLRRCRCRSPRGGGGRAGSDYLTARLTPRPRARAARSSAFQRRDSTARRDEVVRAVEGAGIHVQLHRHAGAHERLRVGDVLVEEQVEVADVDVGRRQAGQVRGTGRRGVRLDVVGAGAPGEVRVPSHDVGGAVPDLRVHDGVAARA